MNTQVQMEATATTGEEVAPPEPAADSAVNWDAVGVELDTVEGDLEVLAVPVVAEVVAPEPEVEVPAVSEPPKYIAPAPVVVPAPSEQEKTARHAEELARLEQLYQLSEADAAAMFAEPDKVLPKLLAKMHQQATQSVLDSMQTEVPRIVQTSEAATRGETEARNAFFSENEDLAKPEFEEAVLRMGALYRQVNPTAPKLEAIQKIGELTRVALGLPAKGEKLLPVAPARPVPFTPSKGGTGGAGVPAQNAWGKLNAEFDSDEI